EQSCTAGRSAFITGQSVFRTGLSKVGVPFPRVSAASKGGLVYNRPGDREDGRREQRTVSADGVISPRQDSGTQVNGRPRIGYYQKEDEACLQSSNWPNHLMGNITSISRLLMAKSS